jgi:hypothetical protein
MPFVALAYQRRYYLFELLNLDITNLYESTHDTMRTLVHEAAICGDSESVYRLLNEFGFYKNLNESELGHLLYDKFSCTPLYYACWFGFLEIAEQLLDCESESLLPSTSFKIEDTSFNTSGRPDDDDDDVFSSSIDEKNFSLVTKSLQIRFEDSSLAISIQCKRFECAKLLIRRSTKSICDDKQRLQNSKENTTTTSTQLDSWFMASMKLESLQDFMSMKEIFHELVLNGCKFSKHLFSLVDSMSDLKQFKFLHTGSHRDHELGYNLFMSYFIKCLTFICSYNLDKLFGKHQCELFWKSIFVKLNELLLLNDRLFLQQCSRGIIKTPCQSNNMEWLKYDLSSLLGAMYTNNLALKYFSSGKFFNFLKKKHVIFNLVNKFLYSYPSDEQTNGGEPVRSPLLLTDLSKIQIKSNLIYMDVDFINKLDIPRHLCQFLGNELSTGLGQSYERTKMNTTLEKL